ncbi:MAG: nuclear transport factor 2 family protein [Rhodobacteraceae bacterium]|nr:nuclear transport factor 2 family protein [Paracoccaceae bacterium]
MTETAHSAVRAAAVAYCHGVHDADAAVFAALCHEAFHMSALAGSGAVPVWDKTAYLERLAARGPAEGAPVYEILDIDVAEDAIARVKLRVAVPPRVFEDYLGFIRVGAEWKLINKLFRTAEGPALEG